MLFWILVIAALFFAFAVLSQHRPHATDSPLVCRTCGTSHPSFARYCRHCGQPLA